MKEQANLPSLSYLVHADAAATTNQSELGGAFQSVSVG